jgi:hypothetical protein
MHRSQISNLSRFDRLLLLLLGATVVPILSSWCSTARFDGRGAADAVRCG